MFLLSFKLEQKSINQRAKNGKEIVEHFAPSDRGGFLVRPLTSLAEEAVQEWELLSPEGVIKVEPMKVNAHPTTLVGKTVVLRANGKHNSDNFLERVAQLLAKEAKDIKVIKTWEAAPETYRSSQNPDSSKKFAEKVASFKPDLVIASQCD
jgi:ABC-type Fe3+-hydroxamate transport system substrate-binding protein